MKYIEQAKTILLTLLVLLSCMFSLMIWNYKPDYDSLEETQVEEVLIGEIKDFEDVLKPYRILFHQDDAFYGTVSNSTVNQLYSHLTSLQMMNVELTNSNISDEKINEMLRANNRLTLFFNEEVPLQLYGNVISFVGDELPETSFTRLIIDWSNIESSNDIKLIYLNTEKRTVYSANAKLSNVESFVEEFVTPAQDFSPYAEVERDSKLSLYVVKEPISLLQYTYMIDTVQPPDTYKEILFSDPKIVQKNDETLQSFKYADNTSLMTVDTQNRILNYVYPPAESIEPISSTSLLSDSFDFINDHGGFTADYRFSSMNVGKHIVEYQLFLKGYPIYSNVTTTRIATTWGDNRLFRYRRPYFTLESDADIPTERVSKQLASGEETVDYIKEQEEIPFNEIEEIVVGYYLIQDPNLELFLLEPSWFVVSNNVWTRISPERLGGIDHGLE